MNLISGLWTAGTSWLSKYVALLELGLAVVCLAVVFWSGWKVRGWSDDSHAKAEVALVQKTVDAYHDSEAVIAALLETKLSGLKANQTIIERRIETVVDRPVYKNVCLDDDGVALINQLRLGTATAASAPEKTK